MQILKFGGSSIQTPERIKNVLGIIKAASANSKIAVVVSALGGVTGKLIEAAELAGRGDRRYESVLDDIGKRHVAVVDVLLKNRSAARDRVSVKLQELRQILLGTYLIKELSPRTLDLVMSFGERLSAFIISESLKKRGVKADYLDSSALIKTDDSFGDAVVQVEKTYRNIRRYFKQHPGLQIVTGFIAANEQGQVTTLGRSGSDYTAALLGAALKVEEVEIWTDVNGVMTSDPRKVPDAFTIHSMSYEEAMEMSHFGSRVIHPKAMQPVLERKIPIRIKNTFEPAFAGTVICAQPESNHFAIRGISSIVNVALLRVQGSGMLGVTGISGRLFGALAKENISVILITQGSSEHSICFAIAPEKAAHAQQIIEKEFALEIYARQIDAVVIEANRAVVAVVGNDMRGTPGIAAKIFLALAAKGVNVVAIAQGSSELNVSVVVAATDEAIALNAIHDAFFKNGRKSLNLFLVGPGLVGGTLLKQIRQLKTSAVDIKLAGLANSRKMVFSGSGVNLQSWKTVLQKKGQPMKASAFVDEILTCKLANCVLVDCTASDAMIPFYEPLLRSGVSVVTPNKQANSGSYERYLKLRRAAAAGDSKFFYETNVGAGLPVLSTIRDLLASGDTVRKLEAVVSGSLSYIFNTFDGRKSFSDIVKTAQKKGYTEPDPRDDLNGLDMARKLIILAREIGLTCELQDIHLTDILPQACRKAKSVDAFFKQLQKADGYFEKLRSQAEKDGSVLRYFGKIENKKLTITLQAVSAEHPFFGLRDTENMIAIYSERYAVSPLVIKGPGAGADVTAAGVLADVLKTVG